MSSRYEKVKCAVCGNEFKTSNHGKTCSMKCRSILKERDKISKSEIKECPICGAVAPLYRKCHEDMVCSKRCVIVLNNRFWNKERGYDVDLHQRVRVPPNIVTCEVCGKKVSGRRYDQKYCSRECKTVAQRRKKSTERKARREAEKKCSLCGVSYDNIPSPSEIGYRNTGFGEYKMHMDHIIPRADGGSNDNSNLRPVCWFCNITRGTMSADLDNAIKAASKAFWKIVIPYWNSIKENNGYSTRDSG